MIDTIIKGTLQNIFKNVLNQARVEFLDDQFRYYKKQWNKIYHDGETSWTPFGYQDEFGVTKYYSKLFPLYILLPSGETIFAGQFIFHEGGKVYASNRK